MTNEHSIKLSDKYYFVEEQPIINFEDYITKVSAFHITFNSRYGKFSIYRGQREDKPLFPSIARDGLKTKEVREKEINIFEEFRRLSYPHLDLNFNYKDDWSMLALAQHHRLPTRLLDWTANPLAALWFACKDIDEKDNEKKSDSKRIVWAFVVENDDIADLTNENSLPFNQEETKVFRPNHITKRITSQNGWFTVHKFGDDKIIPLNEQKKFKGRFVRYLIPENKRFNILGKLDAMGINYYSLFPDLEGLSNYLRRKNKILSDNSIDINMQIEYLTSEIK